MWVLIDFLTGHTASFIYLFIFVGLFLGGLGAPIPEDLLLLLGGFLAWAGYTDLYVTIGISIVGAVVGDYVVFYLGRKWGTNVLDQRRFRRWLSPHLLSKIHTYFDQYGGKTVFFARFFAGFRMAVYMVAGITRMDAKKFIVTDLCGAVLSVPIVTLLAYFLSGQIDTLRHTIRGVRIIVVLLLALSLLCIFVYQWKLKVYLGGGKEEAKPSATSPEDEKLPTAKGGAREGM